MEKRAQGRPSRSVGTVGVQKIVDGIREALRSKRTLDTSRKSLALAIGITPALITYYFPEKDSLLEQVAVPVIEAHRIELSSIVNGEADPEQKLRALIRVLAELYGKDRKLLDIYKDLEAKFPHDYAEVGSMTAILSDFFLSWRGGARATTFEAAVLQGAVCGICELAERVEAADVQRTAISMPSREHTHAWLEPVFRLFVREGYTGAGVPIDAFDATLT